MDFIEESHDYLRGYHAAMLEISKAALAQTKQLQAEHDAARPRFFGGPSAAHYLALGGGRASKALGDLAFERGTAAFAARSGRK